MSVVDGLRGLHAGFYTWATVKLYYSVFYSLRALLAADHVCVFYVGRTPFHLAAVRGASGIKGKGTTHEFVLNLFAQENPGHRFVTQEIDNVSALKWLLARREASNYKIARFLEPEAPDHFRHVETTGIRRLVAAYLADATSVYTFDKDHAMLALPLVALVDASAAVRGIGSFVMNNDELSMLATKCRDNAGPLSNMATMFRNFVA